jgi:outer membrane receptor for ferrienterochelin and colicin
VSTPSNKRQLASGISVIAVAAALTIASPAQAQTTSTLQGHAAAGSNVTATDVNTGHSDSVKADASGNYQIVGLSPSTYRVQSGSAAQTVVVPLGQAVTVDLVSPATTTGAAIVVVGARTKDVKTPAVTTNVSRFQIENLPNGDRNFLNFAALAPGVTVSPPTLGGNARQVQAGAIASDYTNTFIDGISIKNLVNHGGTLGQNYSSGNPFPASAVDQFNVETQNFKAEFEQAGSAVISTVTKTGGNKFHGEIFGEWQPKSFISENYYDRPGKLNNPTGARKKPNFHTKYYGGDIGGPIIPGKLTFFLDYEATDKVFGSNDINVYNGNFAGLSTGAQTYAQTARSTYNGSFPATFKEQLYFGKLTYFATPDDTINVSAFIRHESNLQINGGIRIADASVRNRNNEDRYEAWWNHRGSNWLNEFIVARDAAANGQIPNMPGSAYVVTYTAPQATGGVGCYPVNGMATFTCPNVGNQRVIELGNNFAQDDHQYQTLIKDNVTITAGDHTIKFGGKLNFTKLQRLESNNTTGTYFFDAANFTGVSTSTPYAATINTAMVRPVTAKNTQIGLFVQDDWRPDDHWQVSAGIRWDFESNAKNEKFVTPADVAAALRAYPGWKAAGLNPEDYISTGSNRKPFYGAFQPRLGVSYDLRGDRSLVLFAGAGRYYDRSLFIDSALETIKDYYESNPTLYASQVGPLPTNPDTLRALASTQGGEVFLLNNHLKVPYSDQVTAGVRKRFGSINTSLAISYIKSHNIFQYVVGNRLPDGSYSGAINPVIVYNGIPFGTGIFYGGGAISAAPFPGHGNLFISNSDGKAKYAALYLQADKPYTDLSGWGFSTALTISRARSNDGAAFGDPFWFDTPNVGDQGWQPSRGLERWRFVGTGTVKIPFDIKVSTIVTLSSGPSFGSAMCGVPASVSGPGGPGCYFTDFGILRPKPFLGYKNVDFNVSKTFKMPWRGDHELTVYFQALNAFDFVNRNYSMWTGGFQTYNGPGPTRKPDPGSVASQGRNFKVGARYTF